MSREERPEAEAIRVRVIKTQCRIPTGQMTWNAFYRLYQVNKNSMVGLHSLRASLQVPCRSNLYKFLTGLLCNWNWNFEGDITITEEEAKYLQIIFENQRSYSFWAQGLRVLKEKGKEEAWTWIKENVPVLKLKQELES